MSVNSVYIKKTGDYRYVVFKDGRKVAVCHFVRCHLGGFEMTTQKTNGSKSIFKVDFISDGKEKLLHMRYG